MAKIKYLQTEGKHRHKSGAVTHKNDTVISSLPLDKMFPRRFKNMEQVEEGGKVVDTEPDEDETEKSGDETPDKPKPKAKEITEEFPAAVEKELIVQRTGKQKYRVFDAEGKQVCDGKLTSKNKVAEFVANYGV